MGKSKHTHTHRVYPHVGISEIGMSLLMDGYVSYGRVTYLLMHTHTHTHTEKTIMKSILNLNIDDVLEINSKGYIKDNVIGIF